jgi:hypothetical protein
MGLPDPIQKPVYPDTKSARRVPEPSPVLSDLAVLHAVPPGPENSG